jgi:hypothetical protein
MKPSQFAIADAQADLKPEAAPTILQRIIAVMKAYNAWVERTPVTDAERVDEFAGM